MTPQTKTGFLICLSFFSVFMLLLIKTGSTSPPGDHTSPSSLSHGLQARRPELALMLSTQGPVREPDRQAPPLGDSRAGSEPLPQHHLEPTNRSETERETTPRADQQSKTYVVQKGDTLSRIAREFYDRPTLANIARLVEANKGCIKGKDIIHVGQTLRIPEKK